MSEATRTRVRIFLDAEPVDAERDEPVIAAIARFNPAMERALRDGARSLADSRGLVVPFDTIVHGGAIFRIVSGRASRGTSTQQPEE